VGDKDKLDQNKFRHEVTQPPEAFKTLEKKPYRQRQRKAMQLQGLGQLTSQVIHQLNNLLAVVGFYLDSEDLKTDNNEDRPLRELALCAHHQTVALVKQLQDFGKPSAAAMIPVNINRIIEEIMALIQGLHAEAVFEYSFQEDLPPILIDPVDIQQMLLNLFINAYDAIQEGDALGAYDRPNVIKVMTKIVIAENKPGFLPDQENPERYVLITIEDTGIGIMGENVDRIFDPYYTTKLRKGTGIGLTIVDKVVRKYKGWIDVDSIYRYGTTFSVYFPVRTNTK